MRTKVILKHKREHDCWICSECDTENSTELGRCILCGCQRDASSIILKKWTEEEEKTRTASKPTATTAKSPHTYADTRMSKDEDRKDYDSGERSVFWKVFWFFVFLIIIFLLIAYSKGNAISPNEVENQAHFCSDVMLQNSEKLPSVLDRHEIIVPNENFMEV